MDKEKIKEILYIILAILVAVILVKIAIWLLPIVVVIILAYYIYTKIIKSRVNKKNNDDRVIDVKYKEKGE